MMTDQHPILPRRLYTALHHIMYRLSLELHELPLMRAELYNAKLDDTVAPEGAEQGEKT